MRPPIPYFGGKMTVGPAIAALLPTHRHYVEPYCGSLAVLMARPPAHMETVNDLDGELVTFWRVLRDRPEDLARVCALTPHSRTEYLDSAERAGLDDVELARRVWVRLSQGRGLTLRDGKTGWKHYVYPSGSSLGMPGYLTAYVDRMAAALLYVDPPYLGTTRDHRHNYKHEMKSDADHRAMGEALAAARAAVVVSGYASDLYDRELFPGWDRHTIASFTGNSSGDRNRTEVLWSNRPLGVTPTLFDAEERTA